MKRYLSNLSHAVHDVTLAMRGRSRTVAFRAYAPLGHRLASLAGWSIPFIVLIACLTC